MQYIVHKRFHKIGTSGKEYNLPYGSILNTIGPFIAYDDEAICAITSQDAHMYFACNDDGNGLERGRLTYNIAFADRRPNNNNGFRFTQEERDMLCSEYPHFLRENDEWVLFNNDFFNANIDDLRELAHRLEV